MDQFRGTTIVSVRRNGKVAIAGDGQVSMGNTVMKGNARKVRQLADGRIYTGQKAKEIGLLHEVVSDQDALIAERDRLIDWAQAADVRPEMSESSFSKLLYRSKAHAVEDRIRLALATARAEGVARGHERGALLVAGQHELDPFGLP